MKEPPSSDLELTQSNERVSGCAAHEWVGDDDCPYCTIEQLRSQLPAEMQECTLRFMECEKGHGRLTATNWIDHGCPWCKIEQLQSPDETKAEQPDKADLLSMAACVARCAREEDPALTAKVGLLLRASEALHALAETPVTKRHRGCGPDCSLPAGHLGEHVLGDTLEQCPGQWKDFYGYVRCRLPAGHDGPHGSAVEPAGKNWAIVTCEKHGRVHATWAGCSMCNAEKTTPPHPGPSIEKAFARSPRREGGPPQKPSELNCSAAGGTCKTPRAEGSPWCTYHGEEIEVIEKGGLEAWSRWRAQKASAPLDREAVNALALQCAQASAVVRNREWNFDRYRNGKLKAQGVTVHAATEAEAWEKARSLLHIDGNMPTDELRLQPLNGPEEQK